MSYIELKEFDSKWYNFETPDPNIWLLVKFFEYLVVGVHEDKRNKDKYLKILMEFTKVNVGYFSYFFPCSEIRAT